MADVIGRRIKRLRQARGLSLRALGKLAAVPVSSINSVELGKRAGSGLTAKTCVRLARALGITVDALVRMDEDEEESELVVAVA
jgi:transcriptional regulator with XRE-family HTH domain